MVVTRFPAIWFGLNGTDLYIFSSLIDLAWFRVDLLTIINNKKESACFHTGSAWGGSSGGSWGSSGGFCGGSSGGSSGVSPQGILPKDPPKGSPKGSTQGTPRKDPPKPKVIPPRNLQNKSHQNGPLEPGPYRPRKGYFSGCCHIFQASSSQLKQKGNETNIASCLTGWVSGAIRWITLDQALVWRYIVPHEIANWTSLLAARNAE
jgi:hypothetical protein